MEGSTGMRSDELPIFRRKLVYIEPLFLLL